jgi:hypothetical protein
MTDANQDPAKKSSLFWIGLFVMVASLAPLLLYVVFGPKDGNPIGLGLLMVFGCPIGLLMLFVGLIAGRRK